jgi:hypothetical protein
MTMKRAQNRARWEQRLAGWRRSGLSLAEYCRREGLPKRSLDRWRVRLQRDALAAGSGGPAHVLSACALVPVEIHDQAVQEAASAPGAIEIRLRGGRSLVIQGEYADARLSRLITLVERAA